MTASSMGQLYDSQLYALVYSNTNVLVLMRWCLCVGVYVLVSMRWCREWCLDESTCRRTRIGSFETEGERRESDEERRESRGRDG